MPQKDTLWELDPHTQGKHLVLKRYLNAWFPIMGRYNDRILFIDGFAGPGEYAGGEPGSPTIALETWREHIAQDWINAEVDFVFIEAREDRYEHLEAIVDSLKPKLPNNSSVNVIHGQFDQTMQDAFDRLEEQGQQLAPSLVMIDPFGVSGTPMDVVSQILNISKCEVYISFMYESINRHKDHPAFEEHLDALFGCSDWRTCLKVADREERKRAFFDLYENQLREAGAEYVVHFDLYEGSRLKYGIFFGTQGARGCDRMKEAIWNVAPFGDYAFRGGLSGQTLLDLETVNYGPLRQQLNDEFRGKGWVSIETIEAFMETDKTEYYKGQLREGALIPLESCGEIEVDSSRERARSYPKGKTLIRFS